MMALRDVVSSAERVLVTASRGGEVDPRWQAILEVAEFIQTSPDEVWNFVRRWGTEGDDDVRAAIATCVLEHLLEHHFDRFFPLVQQAVADPRFADTFSLCWMYGQSAQPSNRTQFEQLRKSIAEQRLSRT